MGGAEDRTKGGAASPAGDMTTTAALQAVRELRRRALALGFGFVGLAVLALLVAIYLQLAYQILWGGTLAMLFYPLHREILRLVRGRPTLAATITTALSVVIVVLPAFLMVFNLVAEVQDLWPRIQGQLGPNVYQTASAWLQDTPLQKIASYALDFDPDLGPQALEAELQKQAQGVQDFLLERLRNTTKSVPIALIRLGITIVVFFFFLRHGPEWVQSAKRGLPLVAEHSNRLFAIAERTINAVFRGVIVTAAVQATLAGLGYWVAGASVPVLLGCLTFLGALIPFVGPVAIWVPTSIALFIAGKTWGAIGLALWGMLVVSLVDNVLRPYLIGREMKLPLLWLFLAIIGALKLFGFLGIVVGPAALALATACYRIYMEERKLPSA